MGVMWPMVLVYSYLRLFLRLIFGASVIYPRCSPTSHTPRACIVTGASSGIGKATAELLAVEGYHVILAGRSLARLKKAVEELQQKHKELLLHAMELDLCSASSIARFSHDVEKWLKTQPSRPSLQLLVNNAGILAASQRLTTDGYDSMMMTNYLGPYILTMSLLPLLEKSSQQARIVNVVSFTHRCVRSLEVDDVLKKQENSRKSYEIAKIYENSKVCMLLFTYELHRRLQRNSRTAKISVMAADPGVVRTRIMRELPWWVSQMAFVILKSVALLQTADSGARAVVDAALAPAEISGKYFFGGNSFTLNSSDISYNEILSKQVLERSEFEVAVLKRK